MWHAQTHAYNVEGSGKAKWQEESHCLMSHWTHAQMHFFWGGSGHSKLAKSAHQKALEQSLGIKVQSRPMLRLSHKAMR
jgi:hypothetical protein